MTDGAHISFAKDGHFPTAEEAKEGSDTVNALTHLEKATLQAKKEILEAVENGHYYVLFYYCVNELIGTTFDGSIIQTELCGWLTGLGYRVHDHVNSPSSVSFFIEWK